ncbi:hypothetical protein GQ85_07445 [Rhodococcus rhodochrous]|nr:hypothetical protein GQ85_07445 [Rhodococcus rhodochrous]
MLSIKYEIPLIDLLNKHDCRDWKSEQKRLDKSIHLGSSPDKSALETCEFKILFVVTEVRNLNISTVQASYESFNVKVGTRVGDGADTRFGGFRLLDLLLCKHERLGTLHAEFVAYCFVSFAHGR